MNRLSGIALTVGWVLLPAIVAASEPKTSLSTPSAPSSSTAPISGTPGTLLTPVESTPVLEAVPARPQELVDFGTPPLPQASPSPTTATPSQSSQPSAAPTSFNPSHGLMGQPGNVIDFGTPAVPTELPLRLEIKLGHRRVMLYRGDASVGSYPIAVGRRGWETPKGTFKVMQMFRDPVWVSPLQSNVVIPGGDPDNPLGRHWIGFWTDGKNWIGFHGTPNHQSVGTAASHGCIRMYHKDVEDLFKKVSLGTEVKVVD